MLKETGEDDRGGRQVETAMSSRAVSRRMEPLRKGLKEGESKPRGWLKEGCSKQKAQQVSRSSALRWECVTGCSGSIPEASVAAQSE